MLSGPTRMRDKNEPPTNADSLVSSPATVPNRIFAVGELQSRGLVSPAVASSSGVPYSTETAVKLPPRLTVAMAPRLVRNTERNVVTPPPFEGDALVHAPLPS